MGGSRCVTPDPASAGRSGGWQSAPPTPAYMASPEWYRSRERWLEAWRASHRGSDPVCLVCGQPWRLWRGDLHHRTYARLGREDFHDLAPLCYRDHLCLHAILEGIPAWRRLPRSQATAMIIALLHDRAGGTGEVE